MNGSNIEKESPGDVKNSTLSDMESLKKELRKSNARIKVLETCNERITSVFETSSLMWKSVQK